MFHWKYRPKRARWLNQMVRNWAINQAQVTSFLRFNSVKFEGSSLGLFTTLEALFVRKFSGFYRWNKVKYSPRRSSKNSKISARKEAIRDAAIQADTPTHL